LSWFGRLRNNLWKSLAVTIVFCNTNVTAKRLCVLFSEIKMFC